MTMDNLIIHFSSQKQCFKTEVRQKSSGTDYGYFASLQQIILPFTLLHNNSLDVWKSFVMDEGKRRTKTTLTVRMPAWSYFKRRVAPVLEAPVAFDVNIKPPARLSSHLSQFISAGALLCCPLQPHEPAIQPLWEEHLFTVDHHISRCTKTTSKTQDLIRLLQLNPLTLWGVTFFFLASHSRITRYRFYINWHS